MIQPAPQKSISIDDVLSAEIEAAFQDGIRESLIRDARLGFPAVSGENGQVVYWPPERVLAELGDGSHAGLEKTN
jgi:hypothetical protein